MPEFCENCGALLPPGQDQVCKKCRGSQHQSDEKGRKKDGQIFPFEEAREGQKQFMDDSERALSEGEILLANAPTGIGKTAAVLTSAVKSIRTDMEEKKIFFLTSKQSHHRIAIDTIKDMPRDIQAVDVISKQQMCPREESKLPYPVFEQFCSEKGKQRCNLYNKEMSRVVEKLSTQTRHVDKVIDLSKTRDVCPHKAALSAGSEADIIVCDYNYIFSDIRETIFDMLEMELEDAVVIVDEAHNLPDRVRGHLEEELSLQLLNDSYNTLRDHDRSLASFVKRFRSEIQGLETQEKRISKDFLDNLLDRVLKGGLGQYSDMEDLLGQLNNVARDLLEKDNSAIAPMHLASFLSRWDVEGEGIFRAYEPNPPKFKLSLLDPAVLTKEIFDRIEGAVLMSGTLHPGEMYADLLGIDDPLIKSYSSPFPEEKRKIVSVKNLTTSYKERDIRMFQAYANNIGDISDNVPGNVAAFFPSYQLMNKVADRLRMIHLETEMVVEDKKSMKWEKEQIVDSLKNSRDRLLLAVQGGSLSEGVDYDDNILSSVLIAGIPFPPPSMRLDALEEYYSNKFGNGKGYRYSRVYPALNRVLQAAGRSIRSKEDVGFIALLDKRFNYDGYKKAMPDSFDYRTVDDLLAECDRFFKKHSNID